MKVIVTDRGNRWLDKTIFQIWMGEPSDFGENLLGSVTVETEFRSELIASFERAGFECRVNSADNQSS